jgi:hypothetical protein
MIQTQRVICRLKYLKKTDNRVSGPGSSVGIATDYGLNGPGIESLWGEIFRTRPDRPWGLMGTGSFPGVKWPGRGADHPPPPSAEVENE